MYLFSILFPHRASSWVCVDNSLIFRSNSPFPSRVFMGTNGVRQFCVHVNNPKLNYFQKLQKVNATNFQVLATEFGGESFTSTFQTQSPQPFYRVSQGLDWDGIVWFGFSLIADNWPGIFEVHHCKKVNRRQLFWKAFGVVSTLTNCWVSFCFYFFFSGGFQYNLTMNKFLLYFV